MHLGPVFNATHGGRSNPWFDLIVGFTVLALTWVGYGKQESRVSIWIALGITAICAVFIYSGIAGLLR